MKKIVLVFATVLIVVSGHAQKTSDIGIWGGSSTAWGDMDKNTPFKTFNLNVGAYFRYNFNARFALRAMFLTGKFSDEGTVENAPWSYSKNVHDLSLQAEVNYLRYILGAKKTKWTPYVTGGIGVAMVPFNLRPAEIATFNPNYPLLYDSAGNLRSASTETFFVPTIPFGMGVKFTIGRRLGIGIEYQMRKYLDDVLDDLNDPLAHINPDGELVLYSSSSHNGDWSGYLGAHLTYKIYIGKRICPAYGSKN